MTASSSDTMNLMAIDYGGARIGLALAGAVARLPQPYRTLHNNDTLWDELMHIIEAESVGTLVVGLPRGLNGQETEQTVVCQQFAATLAEKSGLEVALQDEALTSVAAQQELKRRGQDSATADVDSLAACYILQDYLEEHQ